jgi:hypothetical protein
VVAGGVFVNYRGVDSRSYGALLYAELSRHFGADVVFLDSESIDLPAEADLHAEIAAVARCQYRWLRHREASADLDRLRTDLTTDPDLRAAARRRQPRMSGPR